MFQNQIFQVKCFNLETFEIFQTCPALSLRPLTTHIEVSCRVAICLSEVIGIGVVAGAFTVKFVGIFAIDVAVYYGIVNSVVTFGSFAEALEMGFGFVAAIIIGFAMNIWITFAVPSQCIS